VKILLTGASSFTGYWFASTLAKAGHEVTATFRGAPGSYSEERKKRVALLQEQIEAVWNASFGDHRFVELARGRDWDLLCHHGADTTNYRSPDFDCVAATGHNCRSLRGTLNALAEKRCTKVIVTGSVFEPFEGVGDCEQRAFSPYGLSKHFTFELFRYECRRVGLALGKFVIPNPFGPFEDRTRFTGYLAREWGAGRVPSVATPVYVRDNVHVDLLALEYVSFCEEMKTGRAVQKATPSGYIESQGAFARRVASEFSRRLGRELQVGLADQKEFPEPLMRTNHTLSVVRQVGWREAGAWDRFLDYYRTTLQAS
jgi:UDP-glucose 4-epimerase